MTHRGKFHQMEGVVVGPEPVQRPHPPIWTGPLWKNGLVESTLVRAGRLADGFIPTLIPVSEYGAVRDKVRALRNAKGLAETRTHWSSGRCSGSAWTMTGSGHGKRWKQSRTGVGAIRRRCGGRRMSRVTRRTVLRLFKSTSMRGVTHFVMNAGVMPEQMMEQYERFAREVLPLVRGASPSPYSASLRP